MQYIYPEASQKYPKYDYQTAVNFNVPLPQITEYIGIKSYCTHGVNLSGLDLNLNSTAEYNKFSASILNQTSNVLPDIKSILNGDIENKEDMKTFHNIPFRGKSIPSTEEEMLALKLCSLSE